MARKAPLVLLLLAVALAAAGCGVDAESDTGLLLVVTLSEEVQSMDATAAHPDVIRFYVAVKAGADDAETWVLNEAVAGVPVDVTGRDLVADPFRLFVAEDGDGTMETLRILVVGERWVSGQEEALKVSFGQLVDPEWQTLQRGRIIRRTIRLGPMAQAPRLSWTVTGCLISDDGSIRFGSPEDQDCDGYVAEDFGGKDCNDLDRRINPAAEDYNDCDGIDNNCDGEIDPGGEADVDQDGVSACGGDCDDNNPDINPSAEEICDGIDNNCDGKCDEGFDHDHDGYTPCNSQRVNDGDACVWVPHPDCDDTNPNTHPGAEELCDGIDNNCNGFCDEGTDHDGDGYNECGTMNGHVVEAVDGVCAQLPELVDCAPEDGTIHPEAAEICDGFNTDCSAETAPPMTPCYTWESQTDPIVCRGGVSQCNESEGTWSWGTCNPDTTFSEYSVYCALWDYCRDAQQPDPCILNNLQDYSLDCTAHSDTQNADDCGGVTPTYSFPFGFPPGTSCTWHLPLPETLTGWSAVGLIDPGSTGLDPPAPELHSCEAALVAERDFAVSQPVTITTNLSLWTDGNPAYFFLIEVTLQADSVCYNAESMTCSAP